MELTVGSITEGKVTGITKFGAFVSLPDGRSGLVHISEIAYTYVKEVSDFLQVGQEVKVKLVSVDEQGRISLSIKKAQDPPPRPVGRRPAGAPGPDRAAPPKSEVASFEDKLRQFMQDSDSRQSGFRQNERGSRRRGGHSNSYDGRDYDD